MANGLELGQIPFPPSHTPYTPRERRRRRRVPLRPIAGSAPGVADDARTDASGTGESPGTALSILPSDLGPADVQFLVGATRERIQRSFLASFGGHAVGVAIIALLMSLTPERVYEVVEVNRQNYGIVWIPEEGPGGGGGGGGNESLELPVQVELEGPDEAELSIPVEDPPELVDPEPEPPEPLLETQQLTISAVSMAASVDTRPGVLEGLMAARLSQGSGTGGGGGSGDGGGMGPGDGDGLGPGQGGGVGGGVYRPGNDVSQPRLLREVKPQYTADAMRAKIQGTVLLEVVVLPDGTVGEVTVTKSLDPVFGLDAQAIAAAQQWLFAPSTRFGEPVAVLVGLELFFNLR